MVIFQFAMLVITRVGYQFSKAFLTTVPRFVESSEVGTITTLWNLGRGIGCWVIFHHDWDREIGTLRMKQFGVMESPIDS